MQRVFYKTHVYELSILLILVLTNLLFAQSTLDCSLCHSPNVNLWQAGRHANTQNDVAAELGGEWAGLPADSVVAGEDCIACHAPVAVTVDSVMTEVETMNRFFSTTNGLFTSSTQALDSAKWPHVTCVSCHNVPADHPITLPTFAIFNSTTAQYDTVQNTAYLCGQCHGTVRFADTDHRVMDAWKLSKHSHGGQNDVAGELGEAWAGSTPDDVINGPQAEDCIACHAPTSVLANGGITEAEALANFFTTSGGVFSNATVADDAANWPDVACITCHNPHDPGKFSYFNSTTKKYEVFDTSEELCGQCHGNLRFADTDHLSYNIEMGTGGIGVADTLTMPGVQCVDCHMYVSTIDGANSSMFGGHSWSNFIEEEDGSITSSCTSCHSDIGATAAQNLVNTWKTEFADLDSLAQIKVTMADNFLAGSSDSLNLQLLEEAKFNLGYAESDESGGAHNHLYVQSLLNDAIEKSNVILTDVAEHPTNVVEKFELFQNYPNPFNPETTIRYQVTKSTLVTLNVYNITGQLVATLVNEKKNTGRYSVNWNAINVSSGVYIYQIKAGTQSITRKMILMK